MDKLIIEQKLESLRRCVMRVQHKCPSEVETLSNDADLQDIIVLNLSRSIQLCVDIASHIISETERPAPSTMGQAMNVLESLGVIDATTASKLINAIGFRNIAVHDYEAINWHIVFSICTKELSVFQKFAKLIAGFSDIEAEH